MECLPFCETYIHTLGSVVLVEFLFNCLKRHWVWFRLLLIPDYSAPHDLYVYVWYPILELERMVLCHVYMRVCGYARVCAMRDT